MAVTADFIRALAGLSEAELSTATIDTLQVITIAADAADSYPDLTANESMYYQGYKAITLLGPSLLLAIPETIRDNFNSFTRFDNIQMLLDVANAKVAEVESPSTDIISLLDVVPPNIDPVTNEAR